MANFFQKNILPTDSGLIGFSWLIEYFHLSVPLRALSAVSDKRLGQQRIVKGTWMLFDAQFVTNNKAFSHLEFALKHEEVDLLVLKYILKAFPTDELTQGIKSNPKGILSKKIWFYYEFLLNDRLMLNDLPTGKYDVLLDEKKYIVTKNPIKSKRHKINNNLLGSSKICPIITKTPKLEDFIDLYLKLNE